jgi:hypothetical protein
MLQNVTMEKRGGILREICVIDEQLKHKKETCPSPNS